MVVKKEPYKTIKLEIPASTELISMCVLTLSDGTAILIQDQIERDHIERGYKKVVVLGEE